LVWNRLMPEVSDSKLIPGKEYKKLQKKQQTYQLPLEQGKANSSVSGKYDGKRIVLERNKYGWSSFVMSFKSKEVVLKVTEENGGSYDLHFGYKQWLKTAIDAYPPYSITPKDRFKGIKGPFWVAGSYAWSSATLQLKAHYVNWISALALKLSFNGTRVQLTVLENYSAGDGAVIKGNLQ